MSNFYKRVLTSSIMLPSFLFILFLNNYLFLLMLSAIFLITIYELKFFLNKKIFIILLLLIILFLLSLFQLRGNNNSDFYFLLWIMTIVWLSDTGGYVIGKLIGGPKLSIWSPNKTYSGIFGSIIFSQLSFFFYDNIYINSIYSIKIVFLQLIFCLSSIAGDLFFSYLKRINKIKDYSNLIPGHGGLLDRIDGLIFAIIISYIFKILHVY